MCTSTCLWCVTTIREITCVLITLYHVTNTASPYVPFKREEINGRRKCSLAYSSNPITYI